MQVHPWLPDKQKEELCNIIDYQKLSIDACAHASQNPHLPLRVVLQVLFFEQMQLRTALSGCVNIPDPENPPPTNIVPGGGTAMAGQIVQRDGWVTIVRENQVMRVSMERLRSRVRELEQEFNTIKQEMKRVSRTHSSIESSSWFLSRTFGKCKLVSRSSDAREDVAESTGPATPRGSVDRPRGSHHSKHR